MGKCFGYHVHQEEEGELWQKKNKQKQTNTQKNIVLSQSRPQSSSTLESDA